MVDQADLFEYWLIDMEDALGRFRASIPGELASKLTHSVNSLDPLERYALEIYRDVAAAKQKNEAARLDGFARYIGETFRHSLGGKWFIDFSNKQNAFYGLPQLTGMSNQSAQICPLTLATTALDRRTGTFWSTILNSHLARRATGN